MENELELYHYGRKGMKWYQNIYTSGKNAVKKYKKAHAAKVKARAKAKAARDEKAAEKNQKNIEATKAKLRISKNVEEIYKNSHLFTDKELAEVFQRLNTENQIKNLIPEKVNKGKLFADRTVNALDTAGKIFGNASTMVTNLTNLGKALSGKGDGKGDKKGDNNNQKQKQKQNQDNNNQNNNKNKGGTNEVTININAPSGYRTEVAGGKSQTPRAANYRANPDFGKVGEIRYTNLAKTLTNGAAGNLVSTVKSNPSLPATGEAFVNNYLRLPAPDDLK